MQTSFCPAARLAHMPGSRRHIGRSPERPESVMGEGRVGLPPYNVVIL